MKFKIVIVTQGSGFACTLGCGYFVPTALFSVVLPGLWLLKNRTPRVPLRFTRGHKYFLRQGQDAYGTVIPPRMYINATR